MSDLKSLQELAAVEVVLASLLVLCSLVVSGFLCRLFLAISKWFEVRAASLRHDLALNNYREEE